MTYRSKSLLAVVTTTVLFMATRRRVSLSTGPGVVERSTTAPTVLPSTPGGRALPASAASVPSAPGDALSRTLSGAPPSHSVDAASSTTTMTEVVVLELGMFVVSGSVVQPRFGV